MRFMCGIIIDTTNKKLLIPKEVTDSVGATDNFGLLISPDKRRLAIVREDPLDVFIRTQGRRIGRPSKKQSKMVCQYKHFNTAIHTLKFKTQSFIGRKF